MNQVTMIERITKLETTVKLGFENINLMFTNHLATHAEREKFHKRVIIALIIIAGSLSGSLLTVLLRGG